MWRCLIGGSPVFGYVGSVLSVVVVAAAVLLVSLKEIGGDTEK